MARLEIGRIQTQDADVKGSQTYDSTDQHLIAQGLSEHLPTPRGPQINVNNKRLIFAGKFILW